jgi:hypothetical protein
MKTELTEQEQIIATGLFTLAQYKNRELKSIRTSVAQLVEEPADDYGYYGVVDDIVYSDDTPEQCLAELVKYVRSREEE